MTGDFEEFFQCVLRDESLRNELKAIDDLPAFVDRVVELGSERGFAFTADKVNEVILHTRRAWIERWISR